MIRFTLVTAGVLSLAVLLAGTGLVSAQAKDDKPPDPADLQKQIDELRKEVAKQREEFLKQAEALKQRQPQVVRPVQVQNTVRSVRLDGRLGVMVDRPSDVLADQLSLKSGQGMVVTQVIPDSPAAKAGLKVNDVLMQFDGKDVPSDLIEFARMVTEVKPDGVVELMVVRKAKQETIKDVKLPEVKPGVNIRPIPRRP